MSAYISISKSVLVDVDMELDEIADQIEADTLMEMLRKKGGDYVPQNAQLERVYYDMAGKDCPQSLRDLLWNSIGKIL